MRPQAAPQAPPKRLCTVVPIPSSLHNPLKPTAASCFPPQIDFMAPHSHKLTFYPPPPLPYLPSPLTGCRRGPPHHTQRHTRARKGGRGTYVVLDLNIGFLGHQHLNHILVSLACCIVKRGVSTLQKHIEGGECGEPYPNHTPQTKATNHTKQSPAPPPWSGSSPMVHSPCTAGVNNEIGVF